MDSFDVASSVCYWFSGCCFALPAVSLLRSLSALGRMARFWVARSPLASWSALGMIPFCLIMCQAYVRKRGSQLHFISLHDRKGFCVLRICQSRALSKQLSECSNVQVVCRCLFTSPVRRTSRQSVLDTNEGRKHIYIYIYNIPYSRIEKPH